MNTASKACKCVAKANAELVGHGIRVSAAYNLRTHADVAIIATDKLESAARRRKRPPTLYATYCPFCGKSYEMKTTDTSIRT